MNEASKTKDCGEYSALSEESTLLDADILAAYQRALELSLPSAQQNNNSNNNELAKMKGVQNQRSRSYSQVFEPKVRLVLLKLFPLSFNK